MKHWDAIYDIAADNYGIVTSRQASKVTPNADVELSRWAKSGRLESLGRGVYRLTQYSPTPYDSYAEAVALAGEGAYLYGESVLAINDLAKVNPGVVTVALPRRARRNMPDWVRLVQVKDVSEKETYFGIASQPLMSAFQTCRDTVPVSRLRTAVDDAENAGILLKGEAEALRRELV